MSTNVEWHADPTVMASLKVAEPMGIDAPALSRWKRARC